MKRLDDLTEPELRRVMDRAARGIARALPPDTGFVVLAFEFGAAGVSQYISNGRREDIITFLRETADRLESRQDVPR